MNKTLTNQDLQDIQGALRVVVRDEVKQQIVPINQAIQTSLQAVIRDEVRKEIEPLRQDFSELQSSVDGYLKRTEDWHLEFEVLRAQHNQMRHVLVRKNIATEQELSITGS